MRLLVLVVLCIAVMLMGCSLKGYESRRPEHYDFIQEMKKTFEGQSFYSYFTQCWQSVESQRATPERSNYYGTWIRSDCL